MESVTRYLQGVQFEAESRGHRVRTDLEAASGGQDAAMSPPELLLASLGTCAGYYALQYLKANHLPADDLEVRVEAEKAPHPARLGIFRIEIRAHPAAHAEGLRRAVEKCLVHATLLHTPVIEVVIAGAAVKD